MSPYQTLPSHYVKQLAVTAWLMLALGFASLAYAAPSAKLWPAWEPSNQASTHQVDHSAWQRWLDTYLVTLQNGSTAVRYHSVSESDQAQLDAYINQLTSLDPLALNRPEQFAYWVNLYNALTVQVVLDHPKEDSITGMGPGWFNSGPWDEKLATINRKPVTLNDIEHRILRPIWRDHRIHYVVNCASISCPNLSPQAFTAANAEAQMARAEAAYLSQTKGVDINSDGKLVLSKIFQWYREDFGANDTELETYLADALTDLSRGDSPQSKVTPDALRRAFPSRRFTYDWGLNSAP